MVGLYKQIPRLRRQRLMDMAEATSVSTWDQAGRKGWWDRQVELATASSTPVKTATPSLFSFNGQVMSSVVLRQTLGQVLGRGLSA